MKIVVAIDSFKGSLSSIEAGSAAKSGIERAGLADVTVMPLADGGEGTTEALVEGLGGTYVSAVVTGPLGGSVNAVYGILGDGRTAVMEMARASGIMLVDRKKLDPSKATTYGVGEMILDAAGRGCREFIVGIGGSATTDGGAGMLQALGFEITDEKGENIRPGIRDLDRIADITPKNVPKVLKECHFSIACDVKTRCAGRTEQSGYTVRKKESGKKKRTSSIGK